MKDNKEDTDQIKAILREKLGQYEYQEPLPLDMNTILLEGTPMQNTISIWKTKAFKWLTAGLSMSVLLNIWLLMAAYQKTATSPKSVTYSSFKDTVAYITPPTPNSTTKIKNIQPIIDQATQTKGVVTKGALQPDQNKSDILPQNGLVTTQEVDLNSVANSFPQKATDKKADFESFLQQKVKQKADTMQLFKKK